MKIHGFVNSWVLEFVDSFIFSKSKKLIVNNVINNLTADQRKCQSVLHKQIIHLDFTLFRSTGDSVIFFPFPRCIFNHRFTLQGSDTFV
jgi:hypothetical protein